MSEKYDQDKLDMSLLQFLHNALTEVVRVMDYGQTKYDRGGFLTVDDAPRRYTSAMWRHWLNEQIETFDTGDPFYDTEAGAPFKGTIRHDAQVAVNALFRLETKLREEMEWKDFAEDGDHIIFDTQTGRHGYERSDQTHPADDSHSRPSRSRPVDLGR